MESATYWFFPSVNSHILTMMIFHSPNHIIPYNITHKELLYVSIFVFGIYTHGSPVQHSAMMFMSHRLIISLCSNNIIGSRQISYTKYKFTI